MIAAGVLRFGRFTRFVPHSVMIGFLSGVAVNIACGQLPDLTGMDAEGGTAVAKAAYVLLHPGQIDGQALVTGLAAIAIIVGLSKTKLATMGALLALVIPSIVAAVLWAGDVFLVSDEGTIPTGIPVPALPHLRYLTRRPPHRRARRRRARAGAGRGRQRVDPQPRRLAVGAEPRLRRPGHRQRGRQPVLRPARRRVGRPDRAQPDVGRRVPAGPRSSRASGSWSSCWCCRRPSASVAMPTLAGVLIFAAVGSLRPREARAILRTSSTSRVAMVTTFVATLLLPVAAAVGIGVALSLLLQINREALDLKVVQLEPLGDGHFTERPAPRRAAVQPGHRARRLRQPPLRRVAHAAGPPPRPEPAPSGRWWCCACAAGPRWAPRSSWSRRATPPSSPSGAAASTSAAPTRAHRADAAQRQGRGRRSGRRATRPAP